MLRPLVKRPKGSFKTLLSLDGGALRNIISAFVLVEVEQAIKRHLLFHPELLPEDAVISSVEDFDVDLADYFDIRTGTSAGGWLALYLEIRHVVAKVLPEACWMTPPLSRNMVSFQLAVLKD